MMQGLLFVLAALAGLVLIVNFSRVETPQIAPMSGACHSKQECRAHFDQLEKEQRPLECQGIPKQGGAVICRTLPNEKVKIARSETEYHHEEADRLGKIIVGFDRDEKRTTLSIEGTTPVE
ncbi:MAG: hypothetical protein GDA39_07150, partial [Hyphomonadaceae bacterium]|nr:hypothetical protein [Hyphomonadaceae bacterium]